MPYIAPESRRDFDTELNALADKIRTVGDYNYVVSKLFAILADRRGPTYSTFNSLIGVLECAKLEAYRRYVVPYEDQKIAENRDL